MKWQAVLDLARDTLGDDDKTRNSDAIALMHGNDAIREAYALRPDLRLGSYGTAYVEATDAETDDFPLPDELKRAVADYLIARLASKDDEAMNEAMAATAMQLFRAQLLGG